MPNRPSLDDYVDVAERIQDFKDAHPEGSLQTLSWEIVNVQGPDPKARNELVNRTFIVYRAAAFRQPADPTPGHGIAWEPWPGGTPYTKDSELMNAETAAWGRAIVALGLSATRRLASRQEVRARMEDGGHGEPPVPTINREQLRSLSEIYAASGWKNDEADDAHAELRMNLLALGVGGELGGEIADVLARLTNEQFEALSAKLRGPA